MVRFIPWLRLAFSAGSRVRSMLVPIGALFSFLGCASIGQLNDSMKNSEIPAIKLGEGEFPALDGEAKRTAQSKETMVWFDRAAECFDEQDLGKESEAAGASLAYRFF